MRCCGGRLIRTESCFGFFPFDSESIESALVEDVFATLGPEELMHEAKTLGAPYELVRIVASAGRLPVPNFAAGGIATPADAALMMSLGAEAVFVGSGIFKSSDPAVRARAIVRATTHYQDAKAVADASRGLGQPMRGLDVASLSPAERLQGRGW